MPERCPTCGGLNAVREVVGSLGVSTGVSEHKRRTVEYRFTASDAGYDDICGDCEDVLRGAVGPPSKDAGRKEVVAE